jgi:hypothetical protein
MKSKIYEGIDKQEGGAMTPTANIIRDAWVFGIIPEDQTWHPYGHMVSRLPPDLQERHSRIYSEAIEKARAAGWDPELGDSD